MIAITCPNCQERYENGSMLHPWGSRVKFCRHCGCMWDESRRKPAPTRTIRCPNLRTDAKACPPDCPKCKGKGEILLWGW